MTKTIRGRIAGLISQKKTRDQIVAAKPTAEFDAKWGTGYLKPEVFVAILYNDLSRKPSR